METLSGDNRAFLIALENSYERDPLTVDRVWRGFFESIGASTADPAGRPYPVQTGHDARSSLDLKLALIANAFRDHGYLAADVNPLGHDKAYDDQALEPAVFGISRGDLKAIARSPLIPHENRPEPVAVILAGLRQAYLSAVGLDAQHVWHQERRDWLHVAMESRPRHPTAPERLEIARQLLKTDLFENFLRKKLPGTKLFGAEGAEALFPLLDAILRETARANISEVVIGGMHRGRLSQLANVFEKPAEAIFAELMDKREIGDGDYVGDVAYHVGYSGERIFEGRPIKIELSPHPSHLMVVAPVALGRVRAKQRRAPGDTVMGLLLHTDAAFAGQGLTFEMLQLSGLAGFDVGGVINVVVNNQIGFTTLPEEGRSSRFCTDIAKSLGIPVLRVNGNDPDTAAWAGATALTYRNRFKADIIIELVCFRRNGHNEIDDPTFTQPELYEAIREQPPLAQAYVENHFAGAAEQKIIGRYRADYLRMLEASFMRAARPDEEGARNDIGPPRDGLARLSVDAPTGVELNRLKEISAKLCSPPDDMALHPMLERFLAARRKAIDTGQGINWATAEALALGSLLDDGFDIRLTGQDSVRGAFTQRHLCWHDQKTAKVHLCFDGLEEPRGQAQVFNTQLSEAAVLGFEYGFSIEAPDCLTIWEAQFGDFANVAQSIIDQFIVCGEAKWRHRSNLVMLLPHGLEGGNPDHTTGRPERFLQACAGNNFIVANCTTPANYFHILRRQLVGGQRKPLVILSPKSLLRHSLAVSNLADMAEETCFSNTLMTPLRVDEEQSVKRLIFCTGKVFYDLLKMAEENNTSNTVIIRIEQIYPFPDDEVGALIERFSGADVIWCQEEPRNLGPAIIVEQTLRKLLVGAGREKDRVSYAGRVPAPTPGGGSKRRHIREQEELCASALGIPRRQHQPKRSPGT